MELTVTMSRPSVLLPGNLAIFAAGIVSPTALETEGADVGQSRSVPGRSNSIAGPRTSSWYLSPTRTTGVVDPRSTGSSGARLPTIRSGSRSCKRARSTSPTRSTSRTPLISKATRICSSITGPFLNVQFLAFNQAIPPFDNPSLAHGRAARDQQGEHRRGGRLRALHARRGSDRADPARL